MMANGVVSNSISVTLCVRLLRVIVDTEADRDPTDKLDLITYMRNLS